MSIVREVTVGNRTIKFEFNKFAKQANGSVMVSSGGTQVLVTACASSSAKPGQDFFPLGVEYIEKIYATGRIPGGYRKREARPGDHEILSARVIDRPLRPCFPEGFLNEVVINATVLSYEKGFSPQPLAAIGASCALVISDIPFNGPVACLSIGLENGKFIIDPPEDQMTDLDLMIACRPDAVLMVEAGAKFLSEEQMLAAIEFAHKSMEPIFALQESIRKEIGKPKMTFQPFVTPAEVVHKVSEFAGQLVKAAMANPIKQERQKGLADAKEKVQAELNPEGNPDTAKVLAQAYEDLKYSHMRSMVLNQRARIDGRKLNEIRPIACEVGLLYKPHGSSLFTRGETQALATVTLGSSDDRLRTETLYSSDLQDRFMLHYNFPSFSVGEAKMARSLGRREIGHGALARRALEQVMPTENEFGYVVRVVSEVLESNGSSSMATVCSGSMALLHAGVPIKEPVAGIAMGLIKEGDKYAVLSDILGDEDHLGDMDFKVCGTKNGITALQMDIKIGGLSKQILSEALQQAKEGRLHILGKMAEAITEPGALSKFAPQIFKLKVNPDKIRDVIGSGGKNIKKIVADTGVKIDIDDNGIISIAAPDTVSAEAAKTMIRILTTDPEVGEVYLGKVKRVVDFGAFIEIRQGTEGLCHISQLADFRVEKVTDIIKEGDEVMVKVIEIDRQGRIKLSRKEALEQAPR
jgi:polyribonucleotide nucleotidyltransferase